MKRIFHCTPHKILMMCPLKTVVGLNMFWLGLWYKQVIQSPTMRRLLFTILVVLMGLSSSATFFAKTAITACYVAHSGTSTAQHENDHCQHADDGHQHSPDEKPHKHCHQHRACCHTVVFYRHTGQLDTPSFQEEPRVFGVAVAMSMDMRVDALFRPPRLG